MITLREAASGLLVAVESAIESGDWKVDGACDPMVEIMRLKNALAKPQAGLTEYQRLKFADRFHISEVAIEAIASKLKEKNT